MSEDVKKAEQKSTGNTENVNKFPSEFIDLPSGGKIYGKDSPLYDGKIEIKYMTAKEEDILTSANLIKKGIVLQTLLNSLILTEGVNVQDLLIGDKNAVMVAARILAYGPEYEAELTTDSGEKVQHVFNLADCPFKKLPDDVDYSKNEFEFQLPVSKLDVKIKVLVGWDEDNIEKEIEGYKKTGSTVLPELTTRIRHSIIEINGQSDGNAIAGFVNNMLSRDSMALRKEISRISPDIDLEQYVNLEGDMVKVEIPLTANFFWPQAQ